MVASRLGHRSGNHYIHLLWTNASLTPALSASLQRVFGHGEFLKMLQTVLVIFAGASLFGLTGVLFRDEITSERWFTGG